MFDGDAEPLPDFTGRTLLLFDDRTTPSDFDSFRTQLLLETDVVNLIEHVPAELQWRFSEAYRIGVAPVPSDKITIRRYGQFGLITFEPERYLRLPSRAIGSPTDVPDIPDDPNEPLYRIGVRSSHATGDKIRVAVVDSGIVDHPDLANRIVARKTFVNTQTVTIAHGTLCAGIIAGPRVLNGKNGYGIASKALLIDAQVMGDTNIASDDTILQAIEWADRCANARVLVCAAGGKTSTNEPNAIFEHVGRLLLPAGRILITAAGEGTGSAGSSPVEHPGNCESIVAVGAVDRQLVGMPSTPGLVAGGDIVNFVAPGEALPSASLPTGRSAGYATLSGTSAAAAVGGGVAALWAQAGSVYGLRLWENILHATEIISGARFEIVGAGLLKAP